MQLKDDLDFNAASNSKWPLFQRYVDNLHLIRSIEEDGMFSSRYLVSFAKRMEWLDLNHGKTSVNDNEVAQTKQLTLAGQKE